MVNDSFPEAAVGVRKLPYRVLGGRFAICKFPAKAAVPPWARRSAEFLSISRTPEELSIVCPESKIPDDVHAATGWTCLKLQGPFPFNQTGVLTSFVAPLSASAIPIFVVSTFDTDYVLIPEEFSAAAFRALSEAGHELVRD
jgi:hypothetical protein